MTLRRFRSRGRRYVAGAAVCASVAVVPAGCGSATSRLHSGAATRATTASAGLVAWIDSSRLPYERAYAKAHPGADVRWVIYDGNANGTGILESRFRLWDRAGWPPTAPDVVFDTENYDAVELASPPYNDLLDLKPYVPASVLRNYATASLSACTTPSGKLVCLRNDSAADVLWVNEGLFRAFFPGTKPPATWAALIADGESLQKSHPGYIAGDVGDPFDEDIILWGNECPLNEVVATDTVEIAPRSANCTRIARMLARVEGKSFSSTGVLLPTFNPKKVVMMVGPLWFGRTVFQTGTRAGLPNGSMAAYPPPTATDGARVTGAVGGGVWLVSAHSRHPAAAAALAEYMSTSPTVQTPAVDAGLPDYLPDEAAYLKSLGRVFAQPDTTEAAWKTAASEVWTGWSAVPWSTDAVWQATALPNLTANPPKSFSAQLLPYASALADRARSNHFIVKRVGR